MHPVFGDRRPLAETLLGHGEDQLLPAHNLHAHDVVAFLEVHGVNAVSGAPHVAHVAFRKADGHAFVGGKENGVAARGEFGGDQLVSLFDLHGDDAARSGVRELGQARLLNHPKARDQDHVTFGGVGLTLHGHVLALIRQLLHHHDRGHLFARSQVDQVQDVLAPARRAYVGDFVHFKPMEFPGVREHQNVAVGGGDEKVLDEILLARLHAEPPLAPAALLPVSGERRALQIPGVRHRDHRVFVGDQVFELDFRLLLDNLRFARVAVFLLHLLELVDDHLFQDLLARQDFLVPGDLLLQVVVLLLDLVALERGQALQLELEDGLRLPLGEVETRHQAGARFLGLLRASNQLDDGVELRERLHEAFQDVGALLRLAELVSGAPTHHGHTVVDEELDRLGQRQRARLAVDDGQHDHAEVFLELGVLVEVVQEHLGLLAALELDDDAHAVAVGLVTHVRDALELLLLHQLGDALDGLGLVDLVRDLGYYDLLLFLGGPLDGRFGAHGELAPPGLIGGLDAALAVKVGAGGEVRPGDLLENFVEGRARLVDQQDRGVDDFRQIVRRNLGGHADGDAVRAVDQQVRNLGRQDGRLLRGLIEVGNEVHRVLLDVGQEFFRQARQPALRVPVGRRRVAVHRTEVPLPVDQGIAHVKVLRHAHQRVIERRVAVRVILLDHLAHHRRALHVALVRGVPLFVHGVEDAAMHGLQAVADLGQRPPDDHAHRVVEIRLPHLVFDVDGNLLRRRDQLSLVTHKEILPFSRLGLKGAENESGHEIKVFDIARS